MSSTATPRNGHKVVDLAHMDVSQIDIFILRRLPLGVLPSPHELVELRWSPTSSGCIQLLLLPHLLLDASPVNLG